MGKRYIDMTGERYGRLVAVERVEKPNGGRVSYWKCKCDCGNSTIVRRPDLIRGSTRSCGCYALELMKNNKHRETHNESRTKLYFAWQSMKQRCYDVNVENYNNYGGRGISICDEWLEYTNFSKWAKENGYNEELSIDRINVDGNYEPENCRWVDIKVQNRNKTTTRYIEFRGVKKSVSEWSKLLNIPNSTIINRLNKGCSDEEALNVNYRRKNLKK